MCDNCRVFALTEVGANPLASDTVTVSRTTEYYLSERDELRRKAAKDMIKEGLLPLKGEAFFFIINHFQIFKTTSSQ